MEATEHLKQAAEAAVQHGFLNNIKHQTNANCMMVCAAHPSSETLRTPVENMNNTFVEFMDPTQQRRGVQFNSVI
jgi:hypothetical protein